MAKTNSVKAIFGLESTIPEGWLAEWPACLTEKLGIEPVTAQLGAGTGAELGNKGMCF